MAEQTMATVPNDYLNKLIDLETTIHEIIGSGDAVFPDELQYIMDDIGL